MKLSIVVPAYKVEEYIEKCIRSLEQQDLPKDDYEIIVVNDGSPDSCREIVEHLQKEFSNIVLINQENQGVSMARNNAIAMAKGKYIMFVDPDDYVLPNTFEQLIVKAVLHNLDILYLGLVVLDAKGNIEWKTNYSEQEKSIYNGVEGYFASRGNAVRDPDRSCGIVYRKDLLDSYGLQYPKNVPYLEDGLFLGKIFTVAEKVSFLNNDFYQRTTRAGSASNSNLFYSDKATNGFMNALSDIVAFKEKFSFSKSQKGLINHMIVKYVLLVLVPLVSISTFKKYKKSVQKLKALGFSELDSHGVVEPYKKYAGYYNFSPYFFFLQYAKELVLKKIK